MCLVAYLCLHQQQKCQYSQYCLIWTSSNSPIASSKICVKLQWLSFASHLVNFSHNLKCGSRYGDSFKQKTCYWMAQQQCLNEQFKHCHCHSLMRIWMKNVASKNQCLPEFLLSFSRVKQSHIKGNQPSSGDSLKTKSCYWRVLQQYFSKMNGTLIYQAWSCIYIFLLYEMNEPECQHFRRLATSSSIVQTSKTGKSYPISEIMKHGAIQCLLRFRQLLSRSFSQRRPSFGTMGLACFPYMMLQFLTPITYHFNDIYKKIHTQRPTHMCKIPTLGMTFAAFLSSSQCFY